MRACVPPLVFGERFRSRRSTFRLALTPLPAAGCQSPFSQQSFSVVNPSSCLLYTSPSPRD
eukprot:5777829-Alexandrium_andersonii.AAC.1